MHDKQQREFIANLNRSQINQLCLELQSMVTNFKLFLVETHGYTDDEVTKIMFGKKYDELDTVAPRPLVDNNTKSNLDEPSTNPKAEQPNIDFAKLKRDDIAHRRAMLFELEWCLAQIEQGKYPF